MRSFAAARRLALGHDCDRFHQRGRQLDRRCPGGHRRRPASGDQPGDRSRPSPSYALATPADVDRAVASARAALPGWATATPADRSAVLAKLAALAGEHADELVAEEVSQTGKPVRLATRVRRARQRRQHRLLRRRGPPPRGQGHRGVLRRPHLEHPARGGRRRRAPSRRGTTRCRWRCGRCCPRWPPAARVVIKPCELTPLTTLTLARLATEAGPARRRVQRGHRGRRATSAPRWPDIPTSTW